MPVSRYTLLPALALALIAFSLVALVGQFDLNLTAAPRHPALNPPRIDLGIEPGPGRIPRSTGAPSVEWTLHKTADGLHPSGEEQRMVWLMNRARQDPPAEGLWLATMHDPDVAQARDFFEVDLLKLQAEFDGYSAKPPAAYDARLYRAAKAHAENLIARDAQDHDGQYELLADNGFHFTSYRGNVYSHSIDGLHAHAGLNIDWGDSADGMQTGRSHRLAIMDLDGDYTNVGIAFVPENNNATKVGPNVMVGNHASANTAHADHYNKFLVGTVWEDRNGNGLYDPGEGMDGVTVMPDRGTYYAITGNAGGYAIPISADGGYTIAFSGGGLAPCGKGANVKGASVLTDYRPSDSDCSAVTRSSLVLNKETYTGVEVVTAANAITAQNGVVVKATADVTFSAPKITLKAGFRAESGGRFWATTNRTASRSIDPRTAEPPRSPAAAEGPAPSPPESAESAARRITASAELPADLQRILNAAGATPQDIQRDTTARLFVFATNAGLTDQDRNGLSDVYLYDALALELELLSAAPSGAAAAGPSWQPRIDAGGQLAVFVSPAPNLTADDGNSWNDLFLYRVPLRTLERITRVTDAAPEGDAINPVIGVAETSAEVFYELRHAHSPRTIRGIDLTQTPPQDFPVANGANTDHFLPAVTDHGDYLAWIEQRPTEPEATCAIQIQDRADSRQILLSQPASLCAVNGFRPIFSSDTQKLLWLADPLSDEAARSLKPVPVTNPLAP